MLTIHRLISILPIQLHLEIVQVINLIQKYQIGCYGKRKKNESKDVKIIILFSRFMLSVMNFLDTGQIS